MSPRNKGRAVATVVALALAVGAGFAGHEIAQPAEPPSAIELQKQVCPDYQKVQPKNTAEPQPSVQCIAALTPDQVEGVYSAPSPSLLGASATSYSNGRLPSSALSVATGCPNGLAKSAAAAWDHVAVNVHNATGYWLQSNGSVSCYRTYDQQVSLRVQWCNAGNCGNAAVPGTSNHGWGLAIDAPATTVAYIHRYSGGLFGQGYGSCSDAPWEGWHIKYCGGYTGSDPGPYGSGGGGHTFQTLKLHSKGPRVAKLSTHLALLTNLNDKAPHYLAWAKRSKVYTRSIKHAVRRLQHDGKLGTDGIYGPKTAEYQANRWHHFCKVHTPKPEPCK